MKLSLSGRIGGFILAVCALAGCQQEAKREELVSPDAKPGLSVDGGKLVLPAVKGNPGAAYFALSNAGDKAAELAAVHVEGAKDAQMHETNESGMAKIEKVNVKPGETVSFEPGGKHVMVFDLDESIGAGGTTEMTLIFSDGDKLSTPLAVQAAGDAMAGMDHGSGH